MAIVINTDTVIDRAVMKPVSIVEAASSFEMKNKIYAEYAGNGVWNVSNKITSITLRVVMRNTFSSRPGFGASLVRSCCNICIIKPPEVIKYGTEVAKQFAHLLRRFTMNDYNCSGADTH